MGEATTVSGRALKASATFDMPVELANRVDRVDLAGPPSAGGSLLLDEGARRRLVGIVSLGDTSDQPLLAPGFYLERALAPFADIRKGEPDALVHAGVAMIVLPDGDPGPETVSACSATGRSGRRAFALRRAASCRG